MEEWKEYRLSELSNNLGDGLHGTPQYDNNGDFYFINGNNLENGKIIIKDTTKKVSYTEAQKYAKPLSNRSLLVSINGTIGNVAKYNSEKCILGKSTCYFNVKEDFDFDFVYYLVANSKFKNRISHLATGTTIKNVSLETMRNYEFLIPPFKYQKRISSILKSLDDKIELNRRINENLEQQAQALFKSWFVDFEPFKDGKFVDSELGMIPEGWKVGQLLDFGKIICGKTPSKNIKEFFGGDIPFIKIPDMHNQLFIINAEDSLSVEGNQTQQTKLLPPYSLLVSCIATVGLVAINTRPSHTNQQINSIVPQNKNSLYYLYLNLTLMKKQLENMGRGGTATLNINTTSFGKIRMIIPNNEVLVKFSHTVEPLFKEIEILSKQTFELALLRDTLLPKLMSGELKINDFND